MNGIERPTTFMQEPATNYHVADVLVAFNNDLRSTPQQQLTSSVKHGANSFRKPNSCVPRNMKPEENDEVFPISTWTNQGDGIPLQHSAHSASAYPQDYPQDDRIPAQHSAPSLFARLQAYAQGDGIPAQHSTPSSARLQAYPKRDGIPAQHLTSSSARPQTYPKGDGIPVLPSTPSSSAGPQAYLQGEGLPVQYLAPSSAAHLQAYPQGDGIPVPHTAPSSSAHPQPTPDSQGACKATTAGSVSWHFPQQETGQPFLPVDNPELPRGGQRQLQPHAMHEILLHSESRRDAMTVNPMLELQCSAGPLHSYESLPSDFDTTLAISKSLEVDPNLTQGRNTEGVPGSGPETPGLWDASTLAAFGDLRDLTSEESRIVAEKLGVSEMALPRNIQQFMAAFQEIEGARGKLRVLAETLKEARMDIVNAMHGQKSLLPDLGPRMPEKRYIKDMLHSQRLPFTTAISTDHPTGRDWKWLAEYLNISSIYIKNWEQKHGNPGETVLIQWQGKVSEATVGTLFDLMLKMDRGDLADML